MLSRSQIGAMIRAGVDNDRMAACLGINVERLFFLVFCVGCALAGLAGVVAAPVFSVTPDMGTQILIPTLIVVVIGGLGSLKGAVAGSFMVGFIQTFGAVLAPQLAAIAVYALLAAVLVSGPRVCSRRGVDASDVPPDAAEIFCDDRAARAGALYAWAGGYFARELVIEAARLAILAISLDLAAAMAG